MISPSKLCSLCVLPLILLASWPAAAHVSMPTASAQPAPSGHSRDLQQIRDSGVLRVLINQSRNSSGAAIGSENPRLQAFEAYLNTTPHAGRHLTLKIVPKAKDQLLDALLRGEGDLVAPGELLAPRDDQPVSASAISGNVPLVLVSREGGRRYTRIEQLSGHTLALPAGSAAGDALQVINARLVQHRLKPIQIQWVDPSLAVEDVLEMVQAGIYPVTAVEQPIAQRWAKVMPQLRIDSQVTVISHGEMDWFVRDNVPLLQASINSFLKTYTLPKNNDLALQHLYQHMVTVHSPLEKADRQRLEKLRGVLQQHADDHDLDWLNLAALAFKESSLNPSAQGASGATGLLQIKQTTAQHVGVGDVRSLDNNVEAAAKYLALLRRQYFNNPRIAERDRMAFALAAYNIGPQRVQALRAEARREGLNPNQWFFQVERVATAQGGGSAVNYVDSVNKYYLAYDLERETLQPRVRLALHDDE